MTTKNLALCLGAAVLLAAGVGGFFALRGHKEPPAIRTVQQAAQSAVAAVVTVEHADSALARHTQDSVRIVTLTRMTSALNARVAALQERSDSLTDNYVMVPNEALTQMAPNDTAVRLANADTVIAAQRATILGQDTLLWVKDSILGVQQQDNAQLVVALHATRDTLATHRAVVIPAAALSSPGVFARLGASIRNHLGITAGYGVQLANAKLTTGWQLTAGVHIPL